MHGGKQKREHKVQSEGREIDIEQVTKFNYLGSFLTEAGECDKEIRRRIGIAKTHL